MQRLRELARLVEAVYDDIDQTFGSYQKRSGLHCRQGCGACCNNPDIEASELEMLPLAIWLYDQGQAEAVLATLDTYSGFHCIHYVRTSLDGQDGYCGIYAHRPGLCRTFGAAAVSGKQGLRLSVCRVIKQSLPDKYAAALIARENPPPQMAHAKSHITQLDYQLGKQDLPINQALRNALQRVLNSAFYCDEAMGEAVA